MGFLDVLRGKRTLRQPTEDRLFAMTGSHLRMLDGVRGVRPRLLSPYGEDVPDPIGGTAEDVNKHFKLQNKSDHEQTFRVDIPWAILLDSSGKPIAAPDDNALGALDLALDASDPTADRSSATRAFQLTWSRFDDTYKNPSSEVPVQFVPQAPAATAGPN